MAAAPPPPFRFILWVVFLPLPEVGRGAGEERRDAESYP